MARKRRNEPITEPASREETIPAEVAEPDIPDTAAHIVTGEEKKQLLIRFAAIVGAMVLVGYLFSLAGTFTMGYMKLPNMGQIQTDRMGNTYFEPDYSFFHRKFSIGQEDSKFLQVGTMATAFYVYCISNAFHWMIEWSITNLQFMAFMPFLIILAGSGVLCYLFLPVPWRTQEGILYACLATGAAHALTLIVLLVLSVGVSDTFASLFDRRSMEGGQLIGSVIPGVFILVLTNITYAAVAAFLIHSSMLVQSIIRK